MTVTELGARMSSAEFSEWMTYAALEPFGPLRDDLRAGEIAATIANVNRVSATRPQPWEPADFFPVLAGPPVDPMDKLKLFEMRLRALGAKK